MTKWRRILCWMLGITAMILLISLIASRMLLDEERLKAFAADGMQASYGRQLSMDKLSLRLFPVPALHAEKLTLSNPAWAKERHFLQADSVTARLELLPLFKKQVAISALSIDGLLLNLETSVKNGRNWDLRKVPGKQEGKISAIQFNPFNLRSFHLKNSRVRFTAGSPPVKEWLVEEFAVKGETGWRNVNIEANILHNASRMQGTALLDDLSGLGTQGAVSKGTIELTWGATRLSVAGLVPLESELHNHRLKASFESTSLKEIFGFFSLPNDNTSKIAPIKASLDLNEKDGIIHGDNLFLKIGSLLATGKARIESVRSKPAYQAEIGVERMDWAQSMLDIGRPVLPPLPPGQLFRSNPFAWGLIRFLQKADGRIDLNIQHLISRSGIELKNIKAKMDINEQRLLVENFSFAALEGSVKGKLRLDGVKKTAVLNFETERIMLGKWLAERGSKISITGGPMKISASLSGSGTSMKDLVSSMTGPVNISVGPARLYSKRVQQAQSWLTGLLPVFSESSADHVDLACIGANFPFKSGRAEAEPIVGIRSDASQLLTTGYIDFRQEIMDLRGKVRARSGVNLGIANIAGSDIKIAGQVARPEIGLDPDSAPGAIARIGAAILTSGVSLIATAIWDAANPASDPCQITLNAHKDQNTKRKSVHPTSEPQ